MVRLPIDREISPRWLTRELQLAGVTISGVGVEHDGDGNFVSAYAEVNEVDEALALMVIEDHDPDNNEGTAILAAPTGARAWFAGNPQARLIWSMSVTDLVAEIANLVDASFPVLSAGNRLRWKLLLTGAALVIRILVKRERLD